MSRVWHLYGTVCPNGDVGYELTEHSTVAPNHPLAVFKVGKNGEWLYRINEDFRTLLHMKLVSDAFPFDTLTETLDSFLIEILKDFSNMQEMPPEHQAVYGGQGAEVNCRFPETLGETITDLELLKKYPMIVPDRVRTLSRGYESRQ